ncbi:hypothetical protein [Anaerofustis sp. NSJ-163]|uniref:hypothetical protein n=1 Tax=Anaerofustis sp. NSJ-163 TaxID=2944391 RepID=UPI00209C3783|nr:hypothetical protein [Anaerofustis sp. NSJ-163]MCO8194465.1 hypothetical protein [Anaerofustis sp. NSJ-163]
MDISRKEKKILKEQRRQEEEEKRREEELFGIESKKSFNKKPLIIITVCAFIIALLISMVMLWGMFFKNDNTLGKELKVTDSAYMQIPKEWEDYEVDYDSGGTSFSNSQDINKNYYFYFDTNEYKDNIENNIDNWISFQKESVEIKNKIDLNIDDREAIMIEYEDDMGEGYSTYSRYYAIQNGDNVVYILFTTDKNDFSELEKALETFHF